MGPPVFLWPKGVSAKLLVWFFAAVKMQLIFKIFLTIFGVKITNFDPFIQFATKNYHLWLNISVREG